MPRCHLQNPMVVVKVAVGSMISTSGSIALYKRVRSDETFLGDSVVLWITQILCPILSVPSEEGNFSYPRGRAVMAVWIRFGFITQSHRFPKAELCLGKETCDMLTGVTQCSETGQEHRTDPGEQWKQQIRAVGTACRGRGGFCGAPPCNCSPRWAPWSHQRMSLFWICCGCCSNAVVALAGSFCSWQLRIWASSAAFLGTRPLFDGFL